MLTLAFDSCMDKVYAALVKDDEVLYSVKEDFCSGCGRSSDVLRLIKTLLSDNGLTFDKIDLVATNIGPGSFTAIRTCLTVARVIGQELNKKVIGVSTFEILKNLPVKTETKKRLFVLDARRQSAYNMVEGEDAQIKPLAELKSLIKDNYFVIADKKMSEILGCLAYEDMDLNLAEIIAKVAISKNKTETGEWGKLQPLYMNSPAEKI